MTKPMPISVRFPRRRALLAGVATVACSVGFFGVSAFLGKQDAANASEQTAERQGPPPAPVIVADTVETVLAPRAEAPGSAVSIADSVIAAATTAQVTWVAEIGEEIEEGEVLARLDPSNAELALSDARAEVKRLVARAEYLEKLVERYEGLGRETGESEAALDEVRSNYGEAVGALERGRVAARRAQLDLDRTEIRAPFTGKVAGRSVQVGEFANVGAPIVRLVDTERLEVTARASADMLMSVKAGDRIPVAYEDQQAEGIVRAVLPVGDEITRTLEVRVSLSETGWPIGAPVRVMLPSASPRRAVAAPRDALVLRNDGAVVFKVNDDGSAVRVPVRLGAADGDLIELIGEIDAGERVVVRGAERLRDGQAVEIKPATPNS
ncbi:MAG: efflux RND transporter periplasmic adaptor subunit [Alphaproteobacteria bacterium]|nr:efflux RND transporter periplasmic adaptor subunit [Alphaproteobacteria bacterium]